MMGMFVALAAFIVAVGAYINQLSKSEPDDFSCTTNYLVVTPLSWSNPVAEVNSPCISIDVCKIVNRNLKLLSVNMTHNTTTF